MNKLHNSLKACILVFLLIKINAVYAEEMSRYTITELEQILARTELERSYVEDFLTYETGKDRENKLRKLTKKIEAIQREIKNRDPKNFEKNHKQEEHKKPQDYKPSRNCLGCPIF